MNRILFAGFSVRDLIVGGVLVIVASIVIQLLRKAFAGRARETKQVVRCQRCNWVGEVSRFAGRCPSCNEPLGDQLARR